MNEENRNDLQEILTQALNEIKEELVEKFNIDKVNLAELERRTGISRGKLRGLKAITVGFFVGQKNYRLHMRYLPTGL